MSIGCFLGIGAASGDQPEVDAWREAVRAALAGANLPEYVETGDLDAMVQRHEELAKQSRAAKPDVEPAAVQALGRMVMRARGEAAGPLRDFARVSPELFFVPGDFMERVEARGVPGRYLWSTGALLAALKQAAMVLGLPVVNGDVPADLLTKLNKQKKLSKNDLATTDEDESGMTMLLHYRPTWFTLFEYTRLAHDNKIALALVAE